MSAPAAAILSSGKPRRPLRPLYGIPDRDRRGPLGLLLSALLHAAILVLLLLPSLVAKELDLPLTAGGGGPGPAGGGGGGSRGSGGERLQPEQLKYLQVAAPLPAPKPLVPIPPKPEPEPVKPEPTPVVTPIVEPAPTAPTIPIAGTGGGTGTDGSGGNGPGTGGGVGSGAGTGRGSGNGPGTGGGNGDIFPPTVTNLTILPMPVPPRVRPYRMVAWFDVDELGNAKLIAFNPSKDSGYNRKLREMLAEVRFRPAVRQDGTPVRDTVPVVWEAPR